MKITSIQIIQTLRANGYYALWAGGCVRDMLLGHKPKDFDIATNAKPDQIEALFKDTKAVGKAFGVILVKSDGHEFEIASFRDESDYQDGRRPSKVEFASDYEDAMRRDFTINGMFYDPVEDQIIDHVGGQKDLDLKLIKFIGSCEERILEDHLRILRAIRFKNTLGFQYHPETYQALKKHAALIKKISNERIQDELNKMLICKNRVNAINDLEDLGLLDLILPEIQAMKGVAQPHQYHQEGDVYNHTILALSKMPEDLPLSYYWAILFHDSGKPKTYAENDKRITFYNHANISAEIVTKRFSELKFSVNFIKHVEFLCKYHMNLFQILEMSYKNQVKWFLKPWFLDLLEIHKYDTLGTEPSDISMYLKIKDLYHTTVKNLEAKLEDGKLIKLISGEDIMEILKLKPSKKIAEILEEIQDLQIEDKIKNRNEALEFIKNYKI